MVCVPQAQTGKLPSRGSAWEMKFPDKETAMLTLPVEYRDSEKGFSPVPENISYGGRFAGSASFSIFSVDYSVSGFHGIDRNPVMVPELEFTGIMPSGILITPQYYKITSYGADSAIAIGDFTVNLEGTYSHDKRALTKIEEGSMQLPSVEKTGFFNGSAGINWLIDGEDLTLTVEYAKGYFRDNKKYEAPMFSSLLIGSLTFKILNGSVEFEARGMYNTKDKDWVAMPKICYDFKNGLTVEIEGAVMEGRSDSDNSTVFGMYNTRDMARFRTKFTF
jgi:hypothetical protein